MDRLRQRGWDCGPVSVGRVTFLTIDLDMGIWHEKPEESST